MKLNILMMNGARKLIGEAAHALDLTQQLQLAGHDVRLVLRGNCPLLSIATERGFPIAHVMKFAGGFHPVHSLREFRAMRRLMMQFRPDVVHCHRGKDHGLAVAVIKTLPANLRPAVVRTRHRVVPVKNSLGNRWLFGSQTHAVIAVSAKAAESYGAMTPLIADKMTTILSAVDTTRFHPSNRSSEWRASRGIADSEPLVGLIARLQRVKGQKYFLEAAVLVHKKFPAAKFLIAGPGPEPARARLMKYAEELGIGDRVVFADWLPDVPAVAASLDVGVLASLGSEASSRVVYEYLASEVPAVATSVGCIPEILEQGKHGLVCKPADPVGLAEAVIKILENPYESRTRSANARRHVELKHAQENWRNQMIAVYKQAILNNRNPQRVQSPDVSSPGVFAE